MEEEPTICVKSELSAECERSDCADVDEVSQIIVDSAVSSSSSVNKTKYYRCAICYGLFTSRKRMLLHKKEWHNFSCYLCNEVSDSKDSFITHVITNHTGFQNEPEVSNPVHRKEAKVLPKKKKPTGAIAPINIVQGHGCQDPVLLRTKTQVGEDKNGEKIDVKILPGPHGQKEIYLPCKICKKWVNKKHLVYHVRVCHDIQISLQNGYSSINWNRTENRDRPKRFISRQEPDPVHQYSPPLPKYVICDICGKEVARHNVKGHSLVHGEPQFECVQCDKKFKHPTALRYHNEAAHGDRHVCSMCGDTFSTNHTRQLHMKSVHGERDICCQKCPMKFSSKMQFRNHNRRVHLNIRLHQCSYCPKSFYDRVGMLNHENTHTGAKPFKCKFNCDVAYNKRDQLRQHMRKIHGCRLEKNSSVDQPTNN